MEDVIVKLSPGLSHLSTPWLITMSFVQKHAGVYAGRCTCGRACAKTHQTLRQCQNGMIPITMLESLACADNILYACLGVGGWGWFIRTEWVCNTSPSSFLIKLPSYCFMWVTARTRVLLEPRYQSWWKKRANWVKWIIWTHVCCPSQPFRANICINNVLFAIHLEKVECASQFHSRVRRVQTHSGNFF